MTLLKFMEKLQLKRQYETSSNETYQEVINAIAIFKLKIKNIRAKFKFGQHLNKDRFKNKIDEKR